VVTGGVFAERAGGELEFFEAGGLDKKRIGRLSFLPPAGLTCYGW
jgi:hypothetical protein